MYIFITLLPSHSRLTSFSSPSIFSMMLLSICSFVSATKFHILSIFRISEKMHYIVRWLYCVVCYANVKVCDDNLFRTFNWQQHSLNMVKAKPYLWALSIGYHTWRIYHYLGCHLHRLRFIPTQFFLYQIPICWKFLASLISLTYTLFLLIKLSNLNSSNGIPLIPSHGTAYYHHLLYPSIQTFGGNFHVIVLKFSLWLCSFS